MNRLQIAISGMLIFLLVMPVFAFAQSKDKKASEILQEVTDKTKSYNSIKLEFTYQMENPDANINELTEGKALVSGDKYRLDVAGQTVISDGETIWTVISDAEEVQVNDADESEGGFSLTKMLSTYNEEYKSKLLPKITSKDGKNIYALELTPNEKKNFNKVELFVDRDKMEVYAIALYDQNGSTYTYKIVSFTPDVPVADTEFIFNEADFPDFDVIDMR